jgi:hypothetical protein
VAEIPIRGLFVFERTAAFSPDAAIYRAAAVDIKSVSVARSAHFNPGFAVDIPCLVGWAGD